MPPDFDYPESLQRDPDQAPRSRWWGLTVCIGALFAFCALMSVLIGFLEGLAAKLAQ